MWSIRVVDAVLPEVKGIGLPWDDDGSAPDPFVRLLIDGRVVWESPVQVNTRRPQWNLTLPRNIYISSQQTFRLELWDDDTASKDPAGSITRAGLPENARPGAFAHLTLDNLATVTVVVSPPRPSRGLGVEYEQRADALRILAVERFSPAARAGLQVDERVVAIGGKRVGLLSAASAASELSLSADRGATLTVVDTNGKERDVPLDRDYLWLTM